MAVPAVTQQPIALLLAVSYYLSRSRGRRRPAVIDSGQDVSGGDNPAAAGPLTQRSQLPGLGRIGRRPLPDHDVDQHISELLAFAEPTVGPSVAPSTEAKDLGSAGKVERVHPQREDDLGHAGTAGT